MTAHTPRHAAGHEVNVAAVDDLHTRPENTHLIIYLVAFALFVGLSVWGLVAFNQNQRDAESLSKATALAERFQAAGLGTLDVDATARVLGTTGGVACSHPGDALRRGVLDQQIVNGAAGPGQRPIIATTDVVAGERIVIETYCPDQLRGFVQYADDLKLVDDK
ncbi:hypothetical protein FK531_16780 [Rhodococcus spelaei]|uniref:Uncharacterized protein n=1 Tax=Rhodococcus spelaei TaxID=2546320 RepID=A0A541B4G6_9NOCA|nr:hypothetical protein [Rhodococcus spelaei]TQF67209.1 hypothetical protein FK531_16780 [Rhodococcus spelaei]